MPRLGVLLPLRRPCDGDFYAAAGNESGRAAPFHLELMHPIAPGIEGLDALLPHRMAEPFGKAPILAFTREPDQAGERNEQKR